MRHGRTPPRPVRWWRKRGGRGEGGARVCRWDHTGLPGSAPAILDALGRLGARPGALRQIVLTPSHVDHMGSAADPVDATGARVLAGADDVPCISGAAPEPPSVHTPAERALHEQVMTGLARADVPPLRPLPVDVAPSSARGEGRAVLGPFNADRAAAVASFRRLAALEDVDTLCVPHGEPIRTGARGVPAVATPETDWT